MATETSLEPSTNAEAGPGPSSWPSAPIYSFSQPPMKLAQLNASDLDSEVESNFFRYARWSPDGSTILSTSEDRCLRIHIQKGESLTTSKAFKQPEAVLGAVWYPSASSALPESYCFVASIRDHPVRLVDGSDGRIRATYPIVDHRERFIAPHCMAFNPQGTKLYCGFENAIEVMDIASPGYNNSERLKTTFTRKEKNGQKGIISAIAFSTDYSGTYAAGSFSSTVCIYSEDTGANPIQHLEGITGSGVTQIAFHPLATTTVYVGSRRDDHIQVYDLRDSSRPVVLYPRPGTTNQRLQFDVDPWGRYLAAGDEHGEVRVWDTSTSNEIFKSQLHRDAVGAVQLHPFQPLLLSCSGSRSFLRDESEISDSDESDRDDESEEGAMSKVADDSMKVTSFESKLTDE